VFLEGHELPYFRGLAALAAGEDWVKRLRGIRANASRRVA
jgi:hypothetical protein